MVSGSRPPPRSSRLPPDDTIPQAGLCRAKSSDDLGTYVAIVRVGEVLKMCEKSRLYS